MHELSIAMSIIEYAEEESERRGEQVDAIHIRVGALSGVVKEALLTSFEIARQGTSLSGTRLLIEETAVTIYCETCRTERPAHSVQRLCCSVCDAPSAEIRQGRELEVFALELTS